MMEMLKCCAARSNLKNVDLALSTIFTLDPGNPKSYAAARRNEHWEEWKKTIVNEYNNIQSKGVWRKINWKDMKKGKMALQTKWVFITTNN